MLVTAAGQLRHRGSGWRYQYRWQARTATAFPTPLICNRSARPSQPPVRRSSAALCRPCADPITQISFSNASQWSSNQADIFPATCPRGLCSPSLAICTTGLTSRPTCSRSRPNSQHIAHVQIHIPIVISHTSYRFVVATSFYKFILRGRYTRTLLGLRSPCYIMLYLPPVGLLVVILVTLSSCLVSPSVSRAQPNAAASPSPLSRTGHT